MKLSLLLYLAIMVTFPLGNLIVNNTDYDGIESIIHIGLDKLNLEKQEVYLYNLDERYKTLLKDDYDKTKAFIINKDKNVNIIFLKKNLSYNDLLFVLSHEMIHIKQFNENRLQVLDNFQVVWEADTMHVSDFPYQNREWEIEASSQGRKLSRQIKKSL